MRISIPTGQTFRFNHSTASTSTEPGYLLLTVFIEEIVSRTEIAYSTLSREPAGVLLDVAAYRLFRPGGTELDGSKFYSI